MSGLVRVWSAVLTLSATLAFSEVRAADGSCLQGSPSSRTTYSPPFVPGDAPAIPVVKRTQTATNDGEKTASAVAGGPRAGDSGTFVAADGKEYGYRFVEGTRRRTVVETRPDPTSPTGERKFWRYVDEPRLIKLVWPLESVAPEPCRAVENGVETSAAAAPGVFRATARVVVR